MQIALSAKKKMSLVDGSYSEPDKDSNMHALWSRANDMVISWIFNVVSDEISNSLSYVASANDVWNELAQRFAAIDGHKVFNLEKELHKLEQGTDSVEIDYHKLKGLWDELNAIDATTACTCPCKCGFKGTHEKKEERKQLMRFILNLHESYANVKGQILLMKPLPTVNEAYNMVRQDQTQRQGYIPSMSSTVLAATGYNHNF